MAALLTRDERDVNVSSQMNARWIGLASGTIRRSVLPPVSL
jgi:hypothetical protein